MWWNGIHVGFKNQCREDCGFDSHLGDKGKVNSASGVQA